MTIKALEHNEYIEECFWPGVISKLRPEHVMNSRSLSLLHTLIYLVTCNYEAKLKDMPTQLPLTGQDRSVVFDCYLTLSLAWEHRP